MKIFVSHAVVDHDIASALVDFLESGMGVHQDQTFLSSQPGSIKNGQYFVEEILGRLHEALLVICVLSEDYMKSQFCMAELGAARMATALPDDDRRKQFFSCLIPPLQYRDLGGMLTGVQSGLITDDAVLVQLRELVRATVDCNFVPENKWITRLRNFVDGTKQRIDKAGASGDLAKNISLDHIEYVVREDLVHKYKIMFVFRNDSGEELTAGPCEWTGNVRLYELIYPLKMMARGNSDWSKESTKVQVPAGGQFRAWISVHETVDPKYLFGLAALKRAGEIKIELERGGTRAERSFTV